MDNSNLKERNFEEDIEQWLLEKGGYERGFQMTYHKDAAIDLTVLQDFISETQPKEWARYQKIYGAENATDQFYKVLQDDISRYGLIYVLRNGIDDHGVKIRIAYFAPAKVAAVAALHAYTGTGQIGGAYVGGLEIKYKHLEMDSRTQHPFQSGF